MNTSSIGRVDAEQRAAVLQMPVIKLNDSTIVQARRQMDDMMQSAAEEPVPKEERRVSPGGGGPDVRLLIYRPKGAAAAWPAVLYLHEGGYVLGSPDQADAQCARLANATDSVFVAVDYRLAPEAPFPAAIEDAYAALLWLFRHGAELGVDLARIAVMGDSAGGGLAAGLALMARDLGEVRLKAQVLNYPMLDARTGTPDAPSDDPLTGQFIWTREQNRFGWSAMRGGCALGDERIGYASPSLAPSLEGLPSAFLGVGALDLFRPEVVAYAERLASAGVAVHLEVHPSGVHGFNMLPGAQADRYNRNLVETIRRLLLADALG